VCEISFGRKIHSSRLRSRSDHYSATVSIKPAPASHRRQSRVPQKGNPTLHLTGE
jgi:hypothetical protein